MLNTDETNGSSGYSRNGEVKAVIAEDTIWLVVSGSVTPDGATAEMSSVAKNPFWGRTYRTKRRGTRSTAILTPSGMARKRSKTSAPTATWPPPPPLLSSNRRDTNTVDWCRLMANCRR